MCCSALELCICHYVRPYHQTTTSLEPCRCVKIILTTSSVQEDVDGVSSVTHSIIAGVPESCIRRSTLLCMCVSVTVIFHIRSSLHLENLLLIRLMGKPEWTLNLLYPVQSLKSSRRPLSVLIVTYKILLFSSRPSNFCLPNRSSARSYSFMVGIRTIPILLPQS